MDGCVRLPCADSSSLAWVAHSASVLSSAASMFSPNGTTIVASRPGALELLGVWHSLLLCLCEPPWRRR